MNAEIQHLLSGIKKIFSDVDGTFVGPLEQDISEAMDDVLRRLADEKNIAVGLSTGRTVPGVHHLLRHFPKNALHIVAGGAQIIDSEKNILWQMTIDPEFVHQMCELFIKEGAEFLVAVGVRIFATEEFGKILRSDQYHLENFPLTETRLPASILSVKKLTDNIRAFLKGNTDKVEVKEMTGKDGEQYMDITLTGVTKATAFQVWLEMSGLKAEQVAMIGDSGNDAEIMRLVGLPIAVANATEQIKKIAKLQIGSVQENGVGNFLKQILEGES